MNSRKSKRSINAYYRRALCGALLLLVVAPAASWAAATARTLPSAPLSAYESVVADKNGVVTLPEVDVDSTAPAKRLSHCDTTKDHPLSRKVYAHCHPIAQGKPARN